jgi:hypothetical protein
MVTYIHWWLVRNCCLLVVPSSVSHQPHAGPLRHGNQPKLNRILTNQPTKKKKGGGEPTTEPRTTRRTYVTSLQEHIVKQNGEANNSEVIK